MSATLKWLLQRYILRPIATVVSFIPKSSKPVKKEIKK